MSSTSLQVTPHARPEARKIVREKVAVGVYRRVTSSGDVRHEFSYLDRSGKQKWETTSGGLREAKRLRAEKMSKRPEERRAPSRETFADVAALWWEQKRTKVRPATQRSYEDAVRLVLLPNFGRWPIRLIDADSIAALLRDLEREGLHCIDRERPKRPLSRSAVLAYTKPLAQTLAYAARRGLIASNPWLLLTKDDRPVQGEAAPIFEWTSEAIDALLSASRRLATTDATSYDFSVLLTVAVVLGLRLGEILGLRWEDFDREAGELRVARQWLKTREYGPPKTRAGVRTLALPSDLVRELVALRLRSSFSSDESPIFASTAGLPLAHRNVTRHGFEAARDLAGLPSSLSFHSTRHASASRMIDARLDPVTVAGVLGHGDPHVTLKVYAARFDRQRKDDAVRAALAGAARGGER
jgi:integrase